MRISKARREKARALQFIEMHGNTFKVNCDYEYEDLDVSTILDANLYKTIISLAINRVAANYPPIYAMAIVDTITHNQLQQRLMEDLARHNGARIVLIPCNIGNYHWVGLVLEFNDNNEYIRSEYIDSLTSPIPPALNRQLQQVHNQLFTPRYDLYRQDDGTSCGACSIENMLISALRQTVPNQYTMAEIRAAQLSALIEYSHADGISDDELNARQQWLTAFDSRQQRNIPTFNTSTYCTVLRKTHKSPTELQALANISLVISTLPASIKEPLLNILKQTAAAETHNILLTNIRLIFWNNRSNATIQQLALRFFNVTLDTIDSLDQYHTQARLQFDFQYLVDISMLLSVPQETEQLQHLTKMLHAPLEDLKDASDKKRQRAAKQLARYQRPLTTQERRSLIHAVRYDVYCNVRLAALETLYLKGSASTRTKATKAICKYLLYPGVDKPHQDGADLVREQAIMILVRHRNTMLLPDPSILQILRDLMHNDAYQTVRSAAALAVFYRGNYADQQTALTILRQISVYSNNTNSEQDRELIQTNAKKKLVTIDPYLNQLPSQSNPYEKRFGDIYMGFIFKKGDKKILFSKLEILSCLTQAMYHLSKRVELQGYLTLTDNDLLMPSGIQDFITIAHTVTPEETFFPAYVPAFVNGFKIVIGGRLIIIRHQTNRYVYDCGFLDRWLDFFGDQFYQLTAEDIFFIWYAHTKLSQGINESKKTGNLIQEITQLISQFNQETAKHFETSKNFKPAYATQIAEFLVSARPDCLAELSYREVSLCLIREILAQQLTDKEISVQYRQLILNEDDGPETTLTHLPLLVAITMIAEQGRNYFSAIINLQLLDIIDSDNPIRATNSAITWLDAIISSSIYSLSQANPQDKKIRKLADLGGYFCMTQTGSFFENLLFSEKQNYDGTEKATPNTFALKHVLYGSSFNPQLLGRKLSYLFNMVKEEADSNIENKHLDDMFTPPNKPNLNADKAMLTLCEWLVIKQQQSDFLITIVNKKTFAQVEKQSDQQGISIGSINEFSKYLFPLINELIQSMWPVHIQPPSNNSSHNDIETPSKSPEPL